MRGLFIYEEIMQKRNGWLYHCREGDTCVMKFEEDPEEVDEQRIRITKREILVLGFLANGLKQTQIVDRLGISQGRVNQIIKALREKLGCANTDAQAVARALAIGILTKDDVEF
jgi:DNA-binding NarL/FixJ family response regulator